MKIHFFTYILAVAAFMFLFACKTSEPTKISAVDNRSRDEILQSKVDTAPVALPIPMKLGEATLLANEMASTYCDMKQYEDKDLLDEEMLMAYEKLEQKYSILEGKVRKLAPKEKKEHKRLFKEYTKKCGK